MKKFWGKEFKKKWLVPGHYWLFYFVAEIYFAHPKKKKIFCLNLSFFFLLSQFFHTPFPTLLQQQHHHRIFIQMTAMTVLFCFGSKGPAIPHLFRVSSPSLPSISEIKIIIKKKTKEIPSFKITKWNRRHLLKHRETINETKFKTNWIPVIKMNQNQTKLNAKVYVIIGPNCKRKEIKLHTKIFEKLKKKECG